VRFTQVEVIALMELNMAVRLMDPLLEHYAHCDKLMQLLKFQKIDLDLPLEIDLRVTVQWDLDQVDLNLHVFEPGMSHCYAFNNTTRHGGVLSKDVANGLGPEEYLLRRAAPGLYRIEGACFSCLTISFLVTHLRTMQSNCSVPRAELSRSPCTHWYTSICTGEQHTSSATSISLLYTTISNAFTLRMYCSEPAQMKA